MIYYIYYGEISKENQYQWTEITEPFDILSWEGNKKPAAVMGKSEREFTRKPWTVERRDHLWCGVY